MERHLHKGGAMTYPMHHVLGILPNPADVPAVVVELQAAGFAEDAICVLQGKVGCECLDPEGCKHGPIISLLRAWQHFTPEYKHLAQYEQAVHDGHCVVAVRAYHHLDWEPIQKILIAHGGHFIHFYGWMIHNLTP
jgi:hypothetical protein